MSKFSGGYDIYDCMELDGGFDEFKKRRHGRLYQIINGQEREIVFFNYADLIAYFPYEPIDEYWVLDCPHTIIGDKSLIDIMKDEKVNENIIEQFEDEIINEYVNNSHNEYCVYFSDIKQDIFLCKCNSQSEYLDCISNYLRKHKCKKNKLTTTVINGDELLIDNNDDTNYFKIIIKRI